MADDRGDLGRLTRFLVGRPVGLILSGGSLRGFGHVGVVKALSEAQVPVDVICATSAGALVGAEFAMGWSAEELAQRNLEMFAVPRRQMLDYTIPTTSIFGSVALNRALDRIFADRRIEDLWTPFLCTISDLTAAELVVRDAGPLRDAVRASCSLPVLLPPVVGADGHLLADGGVLNNLPVMPLLDRMTIGTLILVNVTEPFYAADEAYDYRDSMPLRRVLNGRFNPLSRRLVAPGIVQVLLRALEIGTKSLEPEQIARADLYIRPRFEPGSYTDTSRMPSVIHAGYEAARRRARQLGPLGDPLPMRTRWVEFTVWAGVTLIVFGVEVVLVARFVWRLIHGSLGSWEPRLTSVWALTFLLVVGCYALHLTKPYGHHPPTPASHPPEALPQQGQDNDGGKDHDLAGPGPDGGHHYAE